MSKINFNDDESLKKISKQAKSVTDNISKGSVSAGAMEFVIGHAKPIIITLVYLTGCGVVANVTWIIKLISKVF